MGVVRIQEAASWRLDDIYRYTLERWGKSQADAYISGLFEAFESIDGRGVASKPVPAELGVEGYFFRYERHFVYWKRLSNGDVGDPILMDAMRAWNKAGFMRIELRSPDGEAWVMRQPFKLDKALVKSHMDSKERPNHLAEFKSVFFSLLQPGAMAAMVTFRTRRQPTETIMGFLATEHTPLEQNELDAVDLGL